MRKAAVRFGLAVLVLGGSVAAQVPAQEPRDGVITGQVVDAVTGRPVSAAIVSISGPSIPVRRTTFTGPSGAAGFTMSAQASILTGADGRFIFRDLPGGRFTIAAAKRGYADGAPGRLVLGGPSQPVVLNPAQRSADVAVRIWKHGAITGTLVDEAGEPVVGVEVRAARRTFTAGRRRFLPIGFSVTTDDRGIYRLSALPPGAYLVGASSPPVSANLSLFIDVARAGRGSGEMAGLARLGVPGSMNGIRVGDAQVMLGRGGAIPPPPVRGRMQIYPPIFHPSALAPGQATPIALASGEERIGVDLQLQPVHTVRVSGTLLAPSGPVGMTSLRLMPAGVDEIAPDALAPVSFTDASGAFVFAAVPPGQYSLRARSRIVTGPPRGGEVYDLAWLNLPITVSGDDVDGVVAVMQPSLHITARLEFDGEAVRPTERPQVMFVGAPFMLETADGTLPSRDQGGMAAALGAHGGVTLAGYSAGRYRVRVQNSPAGWMFKAAMLNGVDVSETPFDFTRDVADLVLTFTDRWSGMGGVVRGPGAGGAMVLAFTTNAQAWSDQGASPRRLKSTRANAGGEFGLSSVPPGEYYVIAVPEEQSADWRDPKALEALARLATQVTVGEGEHRTIDLQVNLQFREVRQ